MEVLEVEVGAASAGAGAQPSGDPGTVGLGGRERPAGRKGAGGAAQGRGLTMRIEEAARSGSQERNIVEL